MYVIHYTYLLPLAGSEPRVVATRYLTYSSGEINSPLGAARRVRTLALATLAIRAAAQSEKPARGFIVETRVLTLAEAPLRSSERAPHAGRLVETSASSGGYHRRLTPRLYVGVTGLPGGLRVTGTVSTDAEGVLFSTAPATLRGDEPDLAERIRDVVRECVEYIGELL